MSAKTLSLERDICRCCLLEGSFIDLAQPYEYYGKEEVYYDMLKDVFNIEVRPVPGKLCVVTYKICETCIQKLRDAFLFREQVISSEIKFKEMYERSVSEVKSLGLNSFIKEEDTGSIGIKDDISSLNSFGDEDSMKVEDEMDDSTEILINKFEDVEDDIDSKFDDDEDESIAEIKAKKRTKGKTKPPPDSKQKGKRTKKAKEEATDKTGEAEGSTPKKKKELETVHHEQLETLPCILDGKFFTYSETESTSTKKVAICTSCRPKLVKISGFNNSTSNFVTHLKRRHGEETYNDYQSYLKAMKKNKRSTRTRTSDRLQSEISDEPTDRTISQEQFNENMLKFFIHSMIPLQAIDDQFFKKIFRDLNISANGLNVPSRRTLGRLIDDYFNKEITDIKNELRDVDELCTTADVWLAKTRSFLGVTAHWLDINLKRKSATLTCRRFSGTHSYDRIAILLEEVHAEFGLDSRKVLTTVTDNGSNFVKAFKEFGIEMESCENFTHNIDDNSEPAESSIVEEDSHIEVISVAHFSTYNEVDHLAFDENIIPQSAILELPVHLRCCAHKLNLCATTDANKVLRNKDTSIGNIHSQVIKKCNNLWNSVGRPKSAEIILNIVGRTLSKPGITRWNSLYDALKQIASIQEKSVQLHVALGMINVLRDNDFHYIKEYLHCSKPIAEALDILQGEQDMYYGILLPCLVSLRKKLQKLNRESLTFCQMLVKKYLESVETRFAEFFDFSSKVAQNAAVAAMSYPRFKDKWLVCVNIEYHSRIKSIFKGAVIKEIHEAPETFQVTPNNIYEDSYFEFDTDSSEPDSGDMYQIQRSKADAIISHFLADQDRDVSMLNRYPEIKRVFKKYNTPLPSSGPVERIFSNATMTNLPKSHRLSDEMFEKRVLLKSNLSHTYK